MNVIITGKVNEGKSTLAYEIAEFLKTKGFINVALRDENHAPGWDRDEDRNARMEHIKHVNIEISVSPIAIAPIESAHDKFWRKSSGNQVQSKPDTFYPIHTTENWENKKAE